jgi:hypothetical protein
MIWHRSIEWVARSESESSQRLAIVRSPGRFSKNPTMSILNYTAGSIPGRPPFWESA